MNPTWALIIILAAFGIVGRIDYDAALATQAWRLAAGHAR